MRLSSNDPAFTESVKPGIVFYAFLALADLGLTLAAFSVGFGESNPALSWFADQGLFEAAKLALTCLVCCVAFRLRALGDKTLGFGNALMVGVIVYHTGLWAVG